MNETHSPTPWGAKDRNLTVNGKPSLEVVASNGRSVGCMFRQNRGPQDSGDDAICRANRDLIVRAVNAHNALIDACEELLGSNVDLSLVEQRARCREVVTNAKAGAK